ncbi:hypothetical protein UlMin_010583 [Ulmus minor]
MKDRFVVLPFSIGCASESSIALGKSDDQVKKPNPPAVTKRREIEESSSSSGLKKKNGFISFLSFHRLIRSIKSFSQIFVYKGEDEIEEEVKEIEIGFPTDVKHVTHIGVDGSTTTNPVKGWQNLNPPELVSFPSISLNQLELAMAAQSHQPLLVDLTKHY